MGGVQGKRVVPHSFYGERAVIVENVWKSYSIRVLINESRKLGKIADIAKIKKIKGHGK